MSEMQRFGLRADYCAAILRSLPDATRADLDAFDRLVASDRLIGDDGAAHADLVAWVQAILDRRSGAAGAVAVVPVKPVPGSAGAMIGGAA
jgi:hypothetical protein